MIHRSPITMSGLIQTIACALWMIAWTGSAHGQESEDKQPSQTQVEPRDLPNEQPLVVVNFDMKLRPLIDALTLSGRYKVISSFDNERPDQLFVEWGFPEVSMHLRLNESTLNGAVELVDRLTKAGISRLAIRFTMDIESSGECIFATTKPYSEVRKILAEVSERKINHIATHTIEFPNGAVGGTALGIPQSAIPGRRWYQSGKMIVAIADDLTKAYAYCEQFPRWTAVEFPFVVKDRLPQVVIANELAAVWLGNDCIAFSSKRAIWDRLTLGETELAKPSIESAQGGIGESLLLRSTARGEFVFKSEWGKWFSADEVKQGKVAEYLMKNSNLGSTEPVKGSLVVLPLKNISAETAEKALQDAYAHGGRLFAKAVPETNTLMIRAEEEVLNEVVRLLEDLQSTAAPVEKNQIVIQLNKVDTQVAIAAVKKFFGLENSNDPDQPIVDGDLASKQLWVKGSETQLGKIRELISQLESSSSEAPVLNRGISDEFKQSVASSKPDPSNVDQLRKRYKALNEESEKIAAKLRESPSDNAIGAQRVRASLQLVILEAFKVQQQLHRAEIDEMTNRVELLRKKLDERQSESKKIIEQRMDELLRPSSTWEGR